MIVWRAASSSFISTSFVVVKSRAIGAVCHPRLRSRRRHSRTSSNHLTRRSIEFDCSARSVTVTSSGV